jgi:hypothetical protein
MLKPQSFGVGILVENSAALREFVAWCSNPADDQRASAPRRRGSDGRRDADAARFSRLSSETAVREGFGVWQQPDDPTAAR